jgi:hypothetical protein
MFASLGRAVWVDGDQILRRLPGSVVVLYTRARIRIVKRTLDRKPIATVPRAPFCGLDCPGAEEMALYIEGKLPGGRHMSIDEHLCYCPACFRLYVDVRRFLLEHESA